MYAKSQAGLAPALLGSLRGELAGAAVLSAALLLFALAPTTGLTLLGAAAYAVLAFAFPRLGLAGVVASLPTYFFPRELAGLAISLPEAALLLTAAAVAARALIWRDVALRRTRFDAGVALLLAAALLSLLSTEYLRLSLRALRTLLLEPVLFFYLTLALCRTGAALRPLWLALLAAASTVSLLALVQVAANVHAVQVEGVRRALGLYPSPNHLGLYLGRALPLALALAWWAPAWRPWTLAAAAVAALAVAATFSVGAWLGVAASLCVLAALVGRRALLVTGGAVTAGGAAVVVLATRLGIERIQPGGTTAAFRQQIWTAALAMIRDHPLGGIGLDNFLYRYQLQYILPAAWAEPNISHPHNWLLQFWLELGLLGLAAFALLVARCCWLAWHAWRRPLRGETRGLLAGAVASLAGLLVHGALDNSYFLVDLSVLFWLHLAIVELACDEPAPPSAPSA